MKANAMYSPLSLGTKLRTVMSSVGEASRLLYGRSAIIALPGNLEITVDFRQAQLSVVDMELVVRCAGHTYSLQIVRPAALADVTLALSDKVPQVFRKAGVLAASNDLWQALEAWLGHPVELLSVGGQASAWSCEQAVGADIQVKRSQAGDRARCSLLLKAADALGWLALCNAAALRLQPSKVDSTLTVDVTALAEPVPLSFDDVAQLQTGDVVLLSESSDRLDGAHVHLAAGGSLLQGVRGMLRGRYLQLTHTKQDNPPPLTFRRHTMNPIAATHPPSEPADVARLPSSPAQGELGKMLMDVQVELGHFSLSITQLHNLAVGQVFETSMPVDGNTVVLWCGAQQIAHGQLVVIGERLGVRIASTQASGADNGEAVRDPLPAPAASAA